MGQIHRTINYILAYVLWAISLVVGFLSAYVARDAFLLLQSINSLNRPERTTTEQFYYNLRSVAVTEWSLLLTGVILVLVVVVIEHFCRTGVPNGRLWQRFCLVTWIEFTILVLSNIPNFVLKGSLGVFTWSTLYYPSIELLVAGLFV